MIRSIIIDPILCAQFLRDYTNVPMLQNVRPEEIEDISERFTHLFSEEREADSVKRIHLSDSPEPIYLVSLIEHKSTVDYNVVMQLLRYMVFIDTFHGSGMRIYCAFRENMIQG